MANNIKGKGELILQKIEFDNCVKRKVGRHSKSARKVTVPKSWELGSTVYVVLVKK